MVSIAGAPFGSMCSRLSTDLLLWTKSSNNERLDDNICMSITF